MGVSACVPNVGFRSGRLCEDSYNRKTFGMKPLAEHPVELDTGLGDVVRGSRTIRLHLCLDRLPLEVLHRRAQGFHVIRPSGRPRRCLW